MLRKKVKIETTKIVIFKYKVIFPIFVALIRSSVMNIYAGGIMAIGSLSKFGHPF